MSMDKEKQARLEAKGWKVGTAAELLGMTREEAAYVDLRLKLSNAVRDFRRSQRLTQAELAARLQSSQSRVAKAEAADRSVTLDLLIRSLLALGATPQDLAKVIAAVFILVILTAFPLPLSAETPETSAVVGVLDAFHAAAARADEAAYFALLAPNGVFLGTDATERWDKAAFQAFAHPYFAKGKAWTFTPRDRHIDFSRDGRVAWFDELLDSASYGECRGSDALEKTDGGWKITQYNLSIPMPNDLSKEFVARIRDAKAAPKPR